jgi:DDE superfamily endonuclease
MLKVVRREPSLFGYRQSRWSLAAILETCDWLKLSTLGALSQLLKRLDISFKRGRSYVHSPDTAYEAKIDYLTRCRMRAWYEPVRYVFLYLDEFGFSRQPSLERNYEQSGHHQALAYRSRQPDTEFRGMGALNAITGQVTYRQHYKIKLRHLSDFYAVIRADYPKAEVIYVAQDNWPVHVHPDILVRLQPQASPFWPQTPVNWSKDAHKSAIQDDLPIQLVFLPTYASWLNPIEKLWRWLRQDILHLHRLSEDWQGLKQAVWDFMAQFANGSQPLLHYVGLFPD